MVHLPGSGFPFGSILTAAGTQPRYYEFQMSLEGLHVPAGTKLHIERSCDVTQNFNKGVECMIGEWAWFLGDDHAFRPDFLFHLLKRNVDVVVPITPCKIAPWMPCLMHGPKEGEKIWHEDMLLYDWDELSGEGLMALPKGDFIGQAGMLVKKHVLDKLGGYPWFKCGQLDPGRLQEDLTFCHELQNAGFTVWIDQDVIFDHYFMIGVTAKRHDGKWVPALVSGCNTIVLPEAKPMLRVNTEAPPGKSKLKWMALTNKETYDKNTTKLEVLTGGKNDI